MESSVRNKYRSPVSFYGFISELLSYKALKCVILYCNF